MLSSWIELGDIFSLPRRRSLRRYTPRGRSYGSGIISSSCKCPGPAGPFLSPSSLPARDIHDRSGWKTYVICSKEEEENGGFNSLPFPSFLPFFRSRSSKLFSCMRGEIKEKEKERGMRCVSCRPFFFLSSLHLCLLKNTSRTSSFVVLKGGGKEKKEREGTLGPPEGG